MKKTNIKTKLTSLVLTMVMLITLLPVMALNVSAAAMTYANNTNLNAAVKHARDTYNTSNQLCAGFVADCLTKGGIDLPNINYSSYNAGKSGCSSSGNVRIWAPSQFKYLIDQGNTVKYYPSAKDVEIGDLIYWDLEGSSIVSHVAIVTDKKSDGTPLITQTNNRHKDKVWTDIGSPYAVVKMSGVSGYDPQGCLDSVTGGTGTVTVRGWAFDRDALSKSCTIHVYIGGPSGSSNAEGYVITANRSRPDVNKAYPGVGDNHGFDDVITTKKHGTQDVYVYAINISGTSGNNVLLGKKTVNISNPASKTATVTGISIKSLPTKTTYNTGETLNTNGLTLSVKWSDGSTTTVNNGYSCSPAALKNTSYNDISKTITVTYQGKTTTFKVTVRKQSGIIINVQNYYNAGYNKQMTGGSPFSIPLGGRVYIRKAEIDPADGILMYEVEYAGQIGWVSSRYLRLE